MSVDYIIVGLGLAGIAIAEELQSRAKSFVVFEDESQTSSLVAGGMYNPVVLKRFNPVWKAAEQLELALPFYARLEKRFEDTFDHQMDILRVFKSVQEQNSWFVASDKPALKSFMVPQVEVNKNKSLKADYLLGRVHGTGRISVKNLVETYRAYLNESDRMVSESFKYDELKLNEDPKGHDKDLKGHGKDLKGHGKDLKGEVENLVRYKNLIARQIIFCEGNGLSDNPFFNDLPLEGTKGELITIYAPDLKLEEVIKSAVFVMPLGDNYYKIGATFNWTDKSNTPTASGKQELIDKLKTVISCDFTVTAHEAGVRPTTQDRRPLVGKHPKHKSLALLNGLGTRGVMSAPLMARKLIDHLENNIALDPEIDISRFNLK